MEARKPREPDLQKALLDGREAELLGGEHAQRKHPLTSVPTAGEPGGKAEESAAIHLHICDDCGSELVYPTDWAPAAPRQWTVELRCPDCEWRGSGTYGQDAVDRFDEVLDDGCQAILDDLTKLTHVNMEEEIERFVAALERDYIVPEDF